MKIAHIALYVEDLETARAFFCTYFGVVSGNLYHNPKTGFRSYFLTFDDGAKLELMTKPQLDELPKPLSRTGWAHLAISLGSRAAVDRLTQRLQADGHLIIHEPRTTGDGYYESCILDFEGNQIELTE